MNQTGNKTFLKIPPPLSGEVTLFMPVNVADNDFQSNIILDLLSLQCEYIPSSTIITYI